MASRWRTSDIQLVGEPVRCLSVCLTDCLPDHDCSPTRPDT